MGDAEWDSLFSFEQSFLHAVGFKLPGEPYVQSDICLGAGRISWAGEAI